MDAEAASKIRADLATRQTGGSRLPSLLGAVGTICLALALAAFVASNWPAIPRPVKLVGIAALLLGAHWLAAFAASRGRRILADLLTVFATLVFVCGMALVGQMYHLPSDWSGGALLVAFGALAAAWACASRGSLVVASIAATCWLIWIDEHPHLTLQAGGIALALLGATGLHVVRHPSFAGRWAVLFQGLAVYGWLVLATATDSSWSQDTEFVVLGLLAPVALGALLTLAGRVGVQGFLPRRREGMIGEVSAFAASASSFGVLILAGVVCLTLLLALIDEFNMSGLILPAIPWPVWAAFAIAAAAAGALLSHRAIENQAFAVVGAVALAVAVPWVFLYMPDFLVLNGAATFAAAIGLTVVGTLISSRAWSAFGNLAITVCLLLLLYETVGSLLDQSVFFLVAGTVLVIAAFVISRRLRKPRAAETGEESQ